MIDFTNLSPREQLIRSKGFEVGLKKGSDDERARISSSLNERLEVLERLAKSAIDDANRADGYSVEFWKNVAATHQRELRSLQTILDEIVNL